MFLSQQMKRIAIKNGKYELTNELPNDVKLKKISKFYGIKVFKSFSSNENIVNTSKKLVKTKY